MGYNSGFKGLICYFFRVYELDSSKVFVYTVETWRECYILEGHPV